MEASPAAQKVSPSVIASTPFDSRGGYEETAPDSHVFFPPINFRRQAKPSTAQAKLRRKGIYSYDPILDKDPNELWRFLMSNLGQPQMYVCVQGTHQVTSGSGDYRKTSTVTDFCFFIDASNDLNPEWSRIAAHRGSWYKYFGAMDTPVPTLRELLEEYTKSSNPFKEFRMQKYVLWDYKRVTQLVTHLVWSTGYRNTITVSFPRKNYKVVALASNPSSRAAHSRTVRRLCVVSCFWIVCWPAWCMARKRVDRLSCEYSMAVSADEFLLRESARIRSNVISRRGG